MTLLEKYLPINLSHTPEWGRLTTRPNNGIKFGTMFFTLSKIFSCFLYPVGFSILLLAVSFFFLRKSPRASRVLGVSAVIFLWISSTEWFSSLLIDPLESRYPRSPLIEKADAVVVLSGMADLKISGQGSVELEAGSDRIIEGILLARRFPDSLLIISGGSGNLLDQETSEAALLSRYLVPQLGIPIERIMVDATSKNTTENSVNTRKILSRNGIERFVLITSASHMPRAMACFHKAGLDPIPWPVDFRSHKNSLDAFSLLPGTGSLMRTDAAIHEYIGLVLYKLMGYI